METPLKNKRVAKSQAFYMYKSIIEVIDRARDINDLLAMSSKLIKFPGWKRLLKKHVKHIYELSEDKLLLNIKEKETEEEEEEEEEESREYNNNNNNNNNNNDLDCNESQKIRNVYLYSCSIEDILPTNIHIYIFEYLESDTFTYLPVVSRFFRHLLFNSPILSKKYRLVLKMDQQKKDFEDTILWNIFHLERCILLKVDRDPSRISNNQNESLNNLNRQFSWHTLRKWSIHNYNPFWTERPCINYRYIHQSNDIFEKNLGSKKKKSNTKNYKRFILVASTDFMYANSDEQLGEYFHDKIENHFLLTNNNPNAIEEQNNSFYWEAIGKCYGWIDYEQEHEYEQKQDDDSNQIPVNYIMSQNEDGNDSDLPLLNYTLLQNRDDDSYQTPFNSMMTIWRDEEYDPEQSALQPCWYEAAQKLDKEFVGLGIATEINESDTINQISEKVQYLYDYILCIRPSIEKLSNETPTINELGLCKCHSMTSFWIEEKNDNDNDNDKFNIFDWSNICIGDEFSRICREGFDSIKNATQYIVWGQQIDFTSPSSTSISISISSEMETEAIGINMYETLKKDYQQNRERHIQYMEHRLIQWKEEMRQMTRGNDIVFELLKKSQQFIRSLTTYSVANHQMLQCPILPNLFHLKLRDFVYNNKLKWIHEHKMPNLRYLTIKLHISPRKIHIDSMLECIDQINIYESVEECKQKFQFKTDPRIALINELLKSLPNLLALVIQLGPGENFSETTLQIPPNIEWLQLQNIPHGICIDLSQCKKLAGLIVKNTGLSSIKWPEKIGCLYSNEYSIDVWNEWLVNKDIVQLYIHNNQIYDWSKNQSIFSQIDPKNPRTEISIDEIIRLWSQIQPLTLGMSPLDPDMVIYYKIIEIMHLDYSHLNEYQKWFEFGLAKWIRHFPDNIISHKKSHSMAY